MATPLGAILPWAGGQFFTNAGAPAVGYKLFFYEAGTTTHQDTYSDSDLATPNTNPVVLDAGGRATVFLSNDTYDVYFATSTAADPPVGADIIKTALGVSASTSLTNTNIPTVAGESIIAGQWIYMSDGTGGLTAGRWYLTDSDEEYKSVLANQIAVSNDTLSAGETGTAILGGRYELLSGTVTTGDTYYLSATAGAITSSSPTNSRAVAIADSTTSVLLSYWTPTAFTTGVMPGGVNGTTVGNVGSGEDDLMSYTVDSNLVYAPTTGFPNVFEFEAFGTTANTGGTKRIRAYLDGTAILDTTAIALQNQSWKISVTVIQRTALTGGCQYVATFTPNAPAAGLNVIVSAAGSTDLVTGFIFKITGQSVSAPLDNDVVQYGMISKKTSSSLGV